MCDFYLKRDSYLEMEASTLCKGKTLSSLTTLREVEFGFRDTRQTTLPALVLQLCFVFLTQKARFSQILVAIAHSWLVSLHAIITDKMLL